MGESQRYIKIKEIIKVYALRTQPKKSVRDFD